MDPTSDEVLRALRDLLNLLRDIYPWMLIAWAIQIWRCEYEARADADIGPTAHQRTEKRPAVSDDIKDEDTVLALVALGFRRSAALEALRLTGWAGGDTTGRVIRVLRNVAGVSTRTAPE